MIGDLNLDFRKWSNPEPGHARMVDRLKSLIETQGFCQIIRGMTRCWPGQPDSQVDHCWTNAPWMVLSHSNEVWSTSDHDLIGVMLCTKERMETNHEIQGRDWKQMDVDRYRNSVKKIDWSDFYLEKYVIILSNMFTERLKQILDREAPVKTKQFRRNYASWMDETLNEMRQRRDLAREKARRTCVDEDWNEFRKIRNKYNKELNKKKM